MLVLYFLLLLASLPAWIWLCVRIWKVSQVGAILSFFLGLPALYFAAKLWDEPDANIRPAAFANLGLFILTLLVWFQLPDDWTQTVAKGSEYTANARRQAEKNRANAEMERWCREENDAAYDPDLKTCVERSKAEALALGVDSAIFSRLAVHLENQGIKGEFDQSKTATAIKLSTTAEIATVAAYYFLPFSMSQPRISVYLCVSESACSSFVENRKDNSTIKLIQNNNLLLTIPIESLEDTRIKELIMEFLDFKAA